MKWNKTEGEEYWVAGEMEGFWPQKSIAKADGINEVSKFHETRKGTMNWRHDVSGREVLLLW